MEEDRRPQKHVLKGKVIIQVEVKTQAEKLWLSFLVGAERPPLQDALYIRQSEGKSLAGTAEPPSAVLRQEETQKFLY